MGKKILRAFIPDATRTAVKDAEPGTPITFIASTEGEKYDGIDLQVEDWDLETFRKNPVLLWSHDYWGTRLPIGRAEVYQDMENRVLKTEAIFDQEDEFARKVEKKYRNGFLHAVSVGWDTMKVEGGIKNILLDISGVNVPGDPDALIERQFRLMKDLFEPEEGGSEEPTPEEHWERAAAEMADLFSPECVLDEGERSAAYHRLTKEYRKLGKTPPELLSIDVVRSLEEKEISGLFLEGEVVFVERLHGLVELTSEQKRELKAVLEKAIEILSEEENDPDGESREEPTEQDLAELEKVVQQMDEILEEKNP